LVALAWRRPLWLALPLVAFSGYVAQAVRFTWMFAPAMWAATLELCSASHEQVRFFGKGWGRAISVSVAGIFGGYFLPVLLPALLNFARSGSQAASTPVTIASPVTVATVTTTVSRQPLLWYRLLPNATYGNGILLGLLFATGLVIAALLHLAVTRRWVLNLWQKMVIIFTLLAFFMVGTIVSAKIGGGGDLHNMDMFIIGLMFAVALAWRGGAAQWIDSAQGSPMWVRLVVLLAIAIPAYGPLLTMRPLSFAKDLNWIVTLTKVESKDLGSLPSDRVVEAALETVRQQVKDAQSRGEVLFMDHRQLLTFGYIQDVTLVSEYEKKRMMDEALSGDAGYFEPYYKDLAAHRFTLIVSDPLRAPIKDSDYQFGEENNAWVKWVVRPTLCYYEPIDAVPEVRLQLLVPKQEYSDCSESLP
jgi:hypothetical protein